MLRLLDGATQLKDATVARDRVRLSRECWQRQAILRGDRFLGELETRMKWQFPEY
jgi:hypothetical protein